MNSQLSKTIARTPNPDCPACQQKRMHNESEWKEYHPLAGTGRFHDVEVGKGTVEVSK